MHSGRNYSLKEALLWTRRDIYYHLFLATLATILYTWPLYVVHLFVILVPFGMLREFEDLGANFIWLTIPFSALVSWVFTTMERIGDSTENPFEGSANDVPISALSRTIEIDFREMLDETDIPEGLKPVNDILM